MLTQKEIIDFYKLENSHAKKELGQNFLLSEEIANQIADSLDLQKEDKLLEIGPGLGAITEKLINKTEKYIAVDVDKKLINFLQNAYKDTNLNVVKENILKFKDYDFNKVVGNLPYYITTDIIEYIALNFKNLEAATFMVQSEFYERITTKDKRIKRPLNYLLEYLFDIKLVTKVKNNQFFPVPTVDSVVFKITKNREKKLSSAGFLYKIIRILFTNRRKNVNNNIGSLLKSEEEKAQLWKEANIAPTTRAEDLTLDDFIRISEIILKIKKINL